MMKLKFIMLFGAIWGIMLFKKSVMARPQDIETAALMAFATAKETVENGAAAHDNKEFEMFGVKAKNDMKIGFGDAMKTKRSPSDSDSSESNESVRRKRSADFTTAINNIRNRSDVSSEESLPLSDYSAISSSESSESDESNISSRR